MKMEAIKYFWNFDGGCMFRIKNESQALRRSCLSLSSPKIGKNWHLFQFKVSEIYNAKIYV